MAANNLQMRGMEDTLTCGICCEMFTDARTLPCQHCFCMACLRDYQTTVVIKPCPLCKEDCVPAARELHRLPPNKVANDMVGLLIKHKGIVYYVCICMQYVCSMYANTYNAKDKGTCRYKYICTPMYVYLYFYLGLSVL